MDCVDVPNLEYVAYILANYFPHNPAPTTPTNSDEERTAAVQAAIWFFTDKFVPHGRESSPQRDRRHRHRCASQHRHPQPRPATA